MKTLVLKVSMALRRVAVASSESALVCAILSGRFRHAPSHSVGRGQFSPEPPLEVAFVDPDGATITVRRAEARQVRKGVRVGEERVQHVQYLGYVRRHLIPWQLDHLVEQEEPSPERRQFYAVQF